MNTFTSRSIFETRTPHKFLITLNPDKKITTKEEIQEMKKSEVLSFNSYVVRLV